MSSSIDQRIVEMQFDNKEFESGIQTSLKSIRNLENGLQLKDGAKGFENIGRAANNVSFDTLGSGVVAIQQKFTGNGSCSNHGSSEHREKSYGRRRTSR